MLHLHVSTMPRIYCSIEVNNMNTERVPIWGYRLLWNQLTSNKLAILLQQINTKIEVT